MREPVNIQNRNKGYIVKKGMCVAIAALAIPSLAAGQDQARSGESRRPSIRMMEAVLSRAVLTGAENLAMELGSGNPNMSFFTGQAKARGFVIDGHGVFFNVEIPEMQSSLVFSVTTLDRNIEVSAALEDLTKLVESSPEGLAKIQAEQALKRLQLTVGPLPSRGGPSSNGPALAAATTRSNLSNETSTADPAPVSPIPARIMRDPRAAYREAIKSALVDAMLEHSRGMSLGPEEWLIVAAHRGDSPLAPNEIVTTTTLMLKIKGNDLALYDADRSRKEEIRQRVDVREF
jgi:hypothetical protein